jgi:lipoprotein-releasing system permease protein
MLGIALGVMALIVVLSVMNGFVSQVRDRMLSVVSHIEVFSLSADRLEGVGGPPRRIRMIGAAPHAVPQALLTRGDAVRGVLVRGIEPRPSPVSDIAEQLRGTSR